MAEEIIERMEKARNAALADARHQRELHEVAEARIAALTAERDALRAELDDLRQQHDYITNAARAVLDMWHSDRFWSAVSRTAAELPVSSGEALELFMDRGEWAEKMNFLYINAYPELPEAEDTSEVSS